MNTGNLAPDEKNDKSRGLPPVGEPVWVQHEGYRTMAYLDKDGKWRKLYDGDELVGAVKVEKPI